MNNNKIKMVMPLAPINVNKDDYTYLNYGHDFYLGFINSWNRDETKIYNKRWYRFSNFDLWKKEDIEKLKKINYLKNTLWFKISIVLNNLAMLDDVNGLKNNLKILSKYLNYDNYIIKDIYLIDIINNNEDIKRPVHISSLAMFNKISHFEILKKYPLIKRIIFHRDIDEDSLFSILKYMDENNIKIELEYFAQNENCYNIDWLCNSVHKVGWKNDKPFVCFREGVYFKDDPQTQKLVVNKANCHLCFISIFDKYIKKYNNKRIFDYIEYFKIPWRWHSSDNLKRYYNASIQFLNTLYNIPWKEQEIKKNIMEENFGKVLTKGIFCWKCFFWDKKV